MKSIMKKIAMMGMLSCMASSNTYTNNRANDNDDGTYVSLLSQIDSLSKNFATVAQDANLSDALKNEYKALTATITNLLAPLKNGLAINQKQAQYVGQHQLATFYNHLTLDKNYLAYKKSNQSTINSFYGQLSSIDSELSDIDTRNMGTI